MRSSTAYFAGAGTVVAAIAVGLGGGLLMGNIVSPKSAPQEVTKLEQRMAVQRSQAAPPAEQVQPAPAPSPILAANTAPPSPTPPQPKSEPANVPPPAPPAQTAAVQTAPPPPKSEPANVPAPSPPAQTAAVTPASTAPAAAESASLSETRKQIARTPEESMARARDADLRRVERRRERSQRWTERRRQRQDPDLREVE